MSEQAQLFSDIKHVIDKDMPSGAERRVDLSGKQLKRQGQARAAGKHADKLYDVQIAARFMGRNDHLGGGITIEDVRTAYELAGKRWDLGNAAGSVFSGDEWKAVGFREAHRPEARCRILRVWRLK